MLAAWGLVGMVGLLLAATPAAAAAQARISERRLQAVKEGVFFDTAARLNAINHHQCASGFEFLPGKCCDGTAKPKESPLTEQMVLRGFHWGRPSALSRDAFAQLFRKLRAGKRVNVQVNGGSFTRGNGCTLNGHPGTGDNLWPCSEHKTWATQLVADLARRFPAADLRLSFNGLGSTTSHFGFALMRDTIRVLEAEVQKRTPMAVDGHYCVCACHLRPPSCPLLLFVCA
jgi:hypothetical protein